MSAYTLVKSYRFEVRGTHLAITDFSREERYIHVEETRKNGQEDCHMSGYLLEKPDGIFEWSDEEVGEPGESSFVFYGSQEIADAILKFINENGYPE